MARRRFRMTKKWQAALKWARQRLLQKRGVTPKPPAPA